MVPIYVTGEPIPSDDYREVATISNMSAATVLNITETSSKMAFAYFCALIVIPSLVGIMLYRFRTKYYSWKK